MVVVSHLFPFYRKILPNYSYFNPRLREGGDILSEISSKVIIISIHASEKEATFTAFLAALFKRISIHASEKEATQTANGAQQTAQISIHASEKEATKTASLCTSPTGFQSTPPKRRRLQHIVIPQLSCTYLVSTTFLSTIFNFISQYVVLFFFF